MTADKIVNSTTRESTKATIIKSLSILIGSYDPDDVDPNILSILEAVKDYQDNKTS